MTQDLARQSARVSSPLGQVVLVFVGVVGGALVAWVAMLVFPSLLLGAVTASVAAAAVYRSRPLRAAAVGMVVGGGIVVAFFAYLFFVAYDGLSAM